ncbi:hypothetical protein V8E51_016260, partial [Hyaloscypha variabilis]
MLGVVLSWGWSLMIHCLGKGTQGGASPGYRRLMSTLMFRERRPLDSWVQGPVTPVRDEARRGLKWRGSPWRRGGGAPHYFWTWEIWDFGWGGGPCFVLLIVMGIGMRGDGWNL